MSDTQHDELVDREAEHDRERREARELAYQEVSLRAVELLASAQRAADEAVAEAQSYARDLEETAREQYQQILQRAHDAARAATGRQPDESDPAGAEASDGGAAAGPAHAGTGLEGRELDYVRTYARVAHSQLRAVLGALTDELDRLAVLADGSSPTSEEVRQAADGAPGASQHAESPHEEHVGNHRHHGLPPDEGPQEHYGDGHDEGQG